jgi:hypothetical protein
MDINSTCIGLDIFILYENFVFIHNIDKLKCPCSYININLYINMFNSWVDISIRYVLTNILIARFLVNDYVRKFIQTRYYRTIHLRRFPIVGQRC